jgi:type IV pilus assembly protein PilQ
LFTRLRHLTASALVAALIAGCATDPETQEKDFFSEWRVKAAESRGQSPPAKQHLQPIDESAASRTQVDSVMEDLDRPLPTRKITMKMSDIDVGVLLRALARVADVNLMLSEKVTGKANINISEAPWDQVFRGLLRTYALTYTWEGDIIRVMTVQDMETELQRESQKQELSKAEPLMTRIVKVNYAEAAKMRANLEEILSLDRQGDPLGSVLVDEHTNSLIMQAIPGDLRRMIKVVDELDRPTSQILIEAQIVETTNDTARALGVQWGGLLYGSSSDNNLWIGADQVDIREDDNTLFDEDSRAPIEYFWPIGNIVNFPLNLEDGVGGSLGILYQNIGNSLLALQLQALQSEGVLNILSSPSITTLENQAALIESGDRIPIQTVENGEVNIEYVEATLKLEVTPNVIDRNTLKLKIITNKDEPDFTRTVAGNPTIITRKAETNVILFNGQTTVIGGLSQETNSSTSEGIPKLKDVPGFGWLFGSRSSRKEMDELLIFITPHVLAEKNRDQISRKDKNPPAGQTPPQ